MKAEEQARLEAEEEASLRAEEARPKAKAGYRCVGGMAARQAPAQVRGSGGIRSGGDGRNEPLYDLVLSGQPEYDAGIAAGMTPAEAARAAGY